MANLIRGIPDFVAGQRTGITIIYRVESDIRVLWLPESDIAGLTLAAIKTLAQARADADTGQPGQTLALFDTEAEAKDDFRNLPGWADWTGPEAEAWIEANVTDLASAKTALVAMAKAIVYLRDIVVQ